MCYLHFTKFAMLLSLAILNIVNRPVRITCFRGITFNIVLNQIHHDSIERTKNNISIYKESTEYFCQTHMLSYILYVPVQTHDPTKTENKF